jgi:hypothetical protein
MSKTSRMLALGALLLPAVAVADLQLTLQMEHRKLMKCEPITVFVTIRNESESYFVAKGEKENPMARLTFLIVRPGEEALERKDAAPILRGVTIRPGEEQRVMVELSRCYPLGAEGGYTVTAVLDWKGARYTSATMAFSVENGIPLAKVSRQVEGQRDSVRTFSLRYLAREGNERMFLRIDDDTKGYNYGTYDLGPLIRVHKPEINIDHLGNITVVHQRGVDCFAKSVFKSTQEGVTFVDQTYHLQDGAPYPKSQRLGSKELEP